MTKQLPIIEVEDVNTANELRNTNKYRQPNYCLKKAAYIFIPLKVK